MGNIKLVMRSPEEDTQTATEGARPSELFGVSDKGERKNEELEPDNVLGGVKEKGKGFIEFLKSVQQKAEEEKQAAAAPPAEEMWSMRDPFRGGRQRRDRCAGRQVPGRRTWVGGGLRTRSPRARSRRRKAAATPNLDLRQGG